MSTRRPFVGSIPTKQAANPSKNRSATLPDFPPLAEPIKGSLISETISLDDWVEKPCMLHVSITDLSGKSTLRLQSAEKITAQDISWEALTQLLPEEFDLEYWNEVEAILNSKRYEHSLAILKTALPKEFCTVIYDLKLAEERYATGKFMVEFPFDSEMAVVVIRPQTLPNREETIAVLGKSEVVLFAKDADKCKEHRAYVFPYLFWDNLNSQWVLSLSGFKNIKIGVASWDNLEDIKKLIDYMLDAEAVQVAAALIAPEEATKIAELSHIHLAIQKQGKSVESENFDKTLRESMHKLIRLKQIRNIQITAKTLELDDRILAYKVFIKSTETRSSTWYSASELNPLRDEILSQLKKQGLYAIEPSLIKASETYSGKLAFKKVAEKENEFQYVDLEGAWGLDLWISCFSEDFFKEMNTLHLPTYTEVKEAKNSGANGETYGVRIQTYSK